MELFSPPCRCARAIVNSCSRCCCFLFLFLRSLAWSPAPRPSSPETTRRTSISCCFSPMMWCLLLLVWPCSRQFSTRNETDLPHPLDRDRLPVGLCAVSGSGRGSHRCAAGGGLPHHLLSRAFGVDSVSAL